MNALGWIVFLSLLFWGIYQKWDENRREYIEHPIRTSLYFFFSSLAIIVLYPSIVSLFEPSFFSIVFFISIISATFLLYKNLKKIFIGPKIDLRLDHAYWKLLDQKYIFPKLFEIGFQQTFLGAIFLIIIDSSGLNLKSVLLLMISFVLAHIPLIFLQGKKIGLLYLKWSILGAPLFSFVILITENLWYSISLHMLFYTALSTASWLFSGTKYSEE